MRSVSILLMIIMFAPLAKAQDKALKVGGEYTITKIDQKSHDYFVITFENKVKTGKFDRLILESDHVHFAVKEGETLRLSAEVAREDKDVGYVSQVLLFLPHVQGYTPVWILSRHGRGNFKSSKYIEMHAPQSDYTIF